MKKIKYWLSILMVMLMVSAGIPADVPITGLPNDPTPTGDDLIATVDDPSGTEVTKKATLTAVFNAILATLSYEEELWHDVAGCDDNVAGIIFDKPSTDFPAAACDTGSNTQKAVLDFDATVDKSFHFKKRLPARYNTTTGFSITFRWKASATSGSAVWCLQGVRVAVGSTSDPAFPAQGAGNCVQDTAAGGSLQENEATISNVTCTSCVAGDLVYFKLSRDADGSSGLTDNMTGNGRLIGFATSIRRFFL